MGCGGALLEEAHYRLGAQVGIALRALEHLDAPVIVGAVAVAQVVARHNLAAGHKGLVAHQHAAGKVAPAQAVGRREMSHAHHAAAGVDNLRLPVDYIGPGGCQGGHALERAGRGQGVAGIEPYQVAAACQAYGLVHGIIYPMVGLAHDARASNAGVGHELQGGVGRGAVDHQVFKVAARLLLHALEGGAYDPGGIPRDRDDGKCGLVFHIVQR